MLSSLYYIVYYIVCVCFVQRQNQSEIADVEVKYSTAPACIYQTFPVVHSVRLQKPNPSQTNLYNNRTEVSSWCISYSFLWLYNKSRWKLSWSRNCYQRTWMVCDGNLQVSKVSGIYRLCIFYIHFSSLYYVFLCSLPMLISNFQIKTWIWVWLCSLWCWLWGSFITEHHLKWTIFQFESNGFTDTFLINSLAMYSWVLFYLSLHNIPCVKMRFVWFGTWEFL